MQHAAHAQVTEEEFSDLGSAGIDVSVLRFCRGGALLPDHEGIGATCYRGAKACLGLQVVNFCSRPIG